MTIIDSPGSTPDRAKKQSGDLLSLTNPVKPRVIGQQGTATPTKTEDNLVQFNKGQSLIDQSTQYSRDVMKGQDFVTQQMLNRQDEQRTAREASARGAAAQRATMSGLSSTAQNILSDINERELSAQRVQEQSSLASTLGQRADAANRQILQTGEQQKMYDVADEQQMLQDLQAGVDLSKPESVESYSKQYEAKYGVKPSLDEIADQKENAYRAKFSAYINENQANFLNDAGEVDFDYIKNNPEANQYINGIYSNMFPGLELNPSDPSYNAFAEDLIKGATTSETDIQWQKAMPMLESLGMPAEQIAELGESFKLASTLGMTQEAFVDLILPDATTIDGEVANVSTVEGTVTIGDKVYTVDVDTGAWTDSDGNEVSKNLAQTLTNEYELKSGEPITEEKTVIDAESYVDKDVMDIASEWSADTPNSEDNLIAIKQILSKDTPPSKSVVEAIASNPDLINEVKDSLSTLSKNATGDGSKDGDRSKFTDDIREGMIYIIDNTPVIVTKAPYSKEWGKGKLFEANRYGQAFDFKPLTGPKAGESLTWSVGRK